MRPTAKDIFDAVNRIAPFDTAEEWDNVGILAGKPDAEVKGVLVALDLTQGALSEARRLGANLLLTHHPILFHARKNLCEADGEAALLCELVRSDIALIAAHTNLDKADNGVSSALADALGLRETVSAADGLLRTGTLEKPTTLADFAARTRICLKCEARVYGNRDRLVSKAAVVGGAGGEYWKDAQNGGADCFVTGEIRHHEALEAVAAGLCLIEAGHMETERVALAPLVRGLQSDGHLLQWELPIFVSQYQPFGA